VHQGGCEGNIDERTVTWVWGGANRGRAYDVAVEPSLKSPLKKVEITRVSREKRMLNGGSKRVA